MDLKNSVGIVTGAASGIGAPLTEAALRHLSGVGKRVASQTRGAIFDGLRTGDHPIF
jgi:hypothetical protein